MFAVGVETFHMKTKMAIHEDSVARSGIQNAIGLGVEKKGTLRPNNVEWYCQITNNQDVGKKQADLCAAP